MIQFPLVVDAHLDLAYNVSRGRDVRMRAKDQPIAHSDVAEIATVGFPDLRAGRVGLICSTIFCNPVGFGPGGYSTPEQARAMALRQLAWYRQMIDEGFLRRVLGREDLPARFDEQEPLNAILLMEGADALRTPDDVQEWFDAGLRIVGLAWGKTRAAGGTGAPGPLTEFGRTLVREFDRLGIIHDASHLAEESFFQLLEFTAGPVMASHSNCRAIVGSDRHLSDEMIRAIISRGGVIGINFYDQFLQPQAEYRQRRCSLADVIAHIRRICDLAGDANHVGLGTDMDGGLGREQIPWEIGTSADLPLVGEALRSAGFSDEDVPNILGSNWLRFFAQHLPYAAV